MKQVEAEFFGFEKKMVAFNEQYTSLNEVMKTFQEPLPEEERRAAEYQAA